MSRSDVQPARRAAPARLGVARRRGAPGRRTARPRAAAGSRLGHPPGQVGDAARVLARAAASRVVVRVACGRPATSAADRNATDPRPRVGADRAVADEQDARRRRRAGRAATTSGRRRAAARLGRSPARDSGRSSGTITRVTLRGSRASLRTRTRDRRAAGRFGRRHAERLAQDCAARRTYPGRVVRSPLALAALATVAVPGLDAFDVRRPAQPGTDFDTAVVIDADPQPVGRPRAAARRRGRGARGRGRPARRCSAAEVERGRLPFAVPAPVGFAHLPEGGRATVHPEIPGAAAAPRAPAARARPRRRRSVARSPRCTSCRPSIVENAGLPVYDAGDVPRSVARPRSTRPRAPARCRPRCSAAGRTRLEDVALWRFRPTVVHGDLTSDRVLVARRRRHRHPALGRRLRRRPRRRPRLAARRGRARRHRLDHGGVPAAPDRAHRPAPGRPRPARRRARAGPVAALRRAHQRRRDHRRRRRHARGPRRPHARGRGRRGRVAAGVTDRSVALGRSAQRARPRRPARRDGGRRGRGASSAPRAWTVSTQQGWDGAGRRRGADDRRPAQPARDRAAGAADRRHAAPPPRRGLGRPRLHGAVGRRARLAGVLPGEPRHLAGAGRRRPSARSRDAPDGAVVIHCSAGRDRTGLVTALLLSLVGVPHDAIVDDYARAVVAMNDYAPAGLGDETRRTDDELAARLAEVTGHLRAFLADLDVAGYLTRTACPTTSSRACERDCSTERPARRVEACRARRAPSRPTAASVAVVGAGRAQPVERVRAASGRTAFVPLPPRSAARRACSSWGRAGWAAVRRRRGLRPVAPCVAARSSAVISASSSSRSGYTVDAGADVAERRAHPVERGARPARPGEPVHGELELAGGPRRVVLRRGARLPVDDDARPVVRARSRPRRRVREHRVDPRPQHVAVDRASRRPPRSRSATGSPTRVARNASRSACSSRSSVARVVVGTRAARRRRPGRPRRTSPRPRRGTGCRGGPAATARRAPAGAGAARTPPGRSPAGPAPTPTGARAARPRRTASGPARARRAAGRRARPTGARGRRPPRGRHRAPRPSAHRARDGVAPPSPRAPGARPPRRARGAVDAAVGRERVGRPGRRQRRATPRGFCPPSSGAGVPAVGLDEPGLGELVEERRDLAGTRCRRPTTPR